MTLWQDQTSRRDRSGVAPSATADPVEGRPLSRREARERERAAAEALAEGREHPSGVYDFNRRDLAPNPDADQDFRVNDTADIWAALSRQSGTPTVDRLRAAEPGIPSAGTTSAAGLAGRGEAPAVPGAGLPPVTDDLMDRVRGAVLGRDRSSDQPAAPQRPMSRRDLRAQRAPEQDVDAVPASWFSESGPARPVAPAAFTGYVEEPTVAMPALDRATLDAQEPVTAVVDLPRFFPEPVGNDELRFSAPVQPEVAEPLGAHPEAEAAPAFLEPEAPAFFDSRRQAERFFAAQQPEPTAWSAQQEAGWAQPEQAWPAQPEQAWPAQPEQPWQDEPVQPAWAPQAAQPAPASPAAFEPAPVQEPRTETTDVPTSLAGFEALISRARSKPGGVEPQAAPAAQPFEQPQQAPAAFQPPVPQPKQTQQPARRPAMPWAGDEPDGQPEGFSGLLSRSATTSGSPSALILPKDPAPDLTQAINGAGDIFVTGQYRLDPSVSMTGAHKEHIDSREADHFFEPGQNEPASGVSPVRATSAVSGGMTGRSPLSKRSYSAALPTVLAVIAGLMAVSVIVLLVGSWVLRVF